MKKNNKKNLFYNFNKSKILFSSFLIGIIFLVSFALVNSVNATGFAGGDGSSSEPYQIENWHHLNNVRNDLNKYYILKNDLDENTEGYNEHASETANEEKGWQSIGDSAPSHRFRGTFDGNGYTISDLYINRPDEDSAALFAHTYRNQDDPWEGEYGIIKNLTLTGKITGKDKVGSIVARNSGLVENCISHVEVRGETRVGGLVGEVPNNGVILDSKSYGDVYGQSGRIGGFVGSMESLFLEDKEIKNQGRVENSKAYGNVYQEGGLSTSVGGFVGTNQLTIIDSEAHGNVNSDSTISFTGGFAGFLSSQNDSPAQIINSHAYGDVSNDAEGTGGFVGIVRHDGIILNSSASGDVVGDIWVGGFVGKLRYAGSIENSFSKGSVFGNDRVGGFVGLIWGSNDGTKINNSYSTGDVERLDGTEQAIGGFVGRNYLSVIENSYSVGNVFYQNNTDPEDKGFAGTVAAWGGDYLSVNNFWDKENSNQGTSLGATGKTTEEMKNIDTFTDTETIGLDEAWSIALEEEHNDETWKIRNLKHYPRLGWEDNFSIESLSIYSDNPDSNLASTGDTINLSFLTTGGLEYISVNFFSGGDEVVGPVTITNPETNEYIATYTVDENDSYGFITFEISAANLDLDYNDTTDESSVLVKIISFNQGEGTVANPYLIDSWEDLDNVRFFLNSHFKLNENLNKESLDFEIIFLNKNFKGDWVEGSYDLNDLVYHNTYYWFANKTTAEIPSEHSDDWEKHSGFTPIGGNSNRFTGSFDGSNKTISDLYIYQPDTDYIGLFGANQGTPSEIYNLILENVNITGKNRTGGLIGEAYSNSKISNVSVSGKVNGVGLVGGIVGYLRNIQYLEKGKSTADVTGTGNRVGGISGDCWQSDVIESESSGVITGVNKIGGLVGRINTSSLISKSFSSGEVYGNNNVGGLIGDVSTTSTVEYSFSLSDVHGNSNVGGFVGSLDSTTSNYSTVKDSYSSGDVYRVSGSNISLGGFIGNSQNVKKFNNYSTGRVFWQEEPHPIDKGFLGSVNTEGSYEMSGNFWDFETSFQTSSPGDALGKTTSEMKDIETFTSAAWNIVLQENYDDEIWKINDSVDYPRLGWEENIPLENLTILKTGTGEGIVTSTPLGIDCGGVCSFSFSLNQVVELSASASEGSEFMGWSGEECSGTGTCIVTMDQAKELTAEFNSDIIEHSLTLLKDPTIGGEVTGAGNYTQGYEVTITANPNPGYEFINWTVSGTDTVISTSSTYIFNMPDNNLEYTANFEEVIEVYKNLVIVGASLMAKSFGTSLEEPHPEATQKLRDITGINDLNVYGYGFSGLKMVDYDKQEENIIEKLDQAYEAFPNNDTLFIIDTGGNDITSMSPDRAYSEITSEQLKKFRDDLDAVFDKVNERNGDVIVADLTFRSHRNPLEPASAENFITDFSGSGPYIENEFRPRQTEHQPHFLNTDNRSVVDKYNFIRNHWTALLHTDGVHLNASSYPVFRDFILERVAYLFTDDEMPEPVEIEFNEHSDLIIIDIGTIEKSEYNTRSATHHPVNFSAITNEKPVTTLLKTITGNDVGDFILDTTITDLTEAKIGVSTSTILPEDENASYKNWEVYSKEIMETALYFNEGESVTIKLTGLEINSVYDVNFVGSTTEVDGGNLNLKDVRSLNEDEISTTEAIPLTGNFTAETNYAGDLELIATSSDGRGYLSGISLEYVGEVEFEEVIVGEASDAGVRYRDNEKVIQIVDVESNNLQIGNRSNSFLLLHKAVYVFKLPEIETGKVIDNVVLSFHHSGRDGVSDIDYNVDLRGIRYSSNNAVILDDYDTEGVLIQEDILNTTLSPSRHINTSENGSLNLTNWINSLYDSGAEEGDYIFLRLEPDSTPKNTSFNSFRVDAADISDEEKRPKLLIEYANTYNVIFNANGGVGSMANQSITFGDSANLTSNTFTKTGYTFAGWNTQENGEGDSYADEVEFTMDVEGQTLYAQWDINQYTITFDSAGGSAVDSITQDYGTDITAPADPSKTGHTFTAWDPELPETMPTEDKTHTAQWTANSYDIIFNANEGTGTMANQSITFDTSASLNANEFTKTGYTFAGWNTQENGEGDSYADEVEFTMDVEGQTLYAQWDINQYTLTYTAGDNGSIDGEVSQTVNYGEDGTLVTAVPSSGYEFDKWSDNLDSASRTDTNVVEDINVSASFIRKKSSSSGFIPPGAIGDGQTDVTVPINSSGNIGQVDRKGVNYLSYINSQASFSTLISSTDSLSDHYLIINNLDLLNNTISFTVKSDPQTFQLSLGEKILVDLDGDGINDIEIKFTDIYINRSELTIKSVLDGQRIDPEIPVSPSLNREEIIQEARDSFKQKNIELSQRLTGRILLQVERHGQAWYLEPQSQTRYFLGRPADAFSIMRHFGLGVSEINFNKFKDQGVPSHLSGRIIIRPEANGEAYYINPSNLKLHYLGRPKDAFLIMQELALGILNKNLDQLEIDEI